jgi:hypothetical protein
MNLLWLKRGGAVVMAVFSIAACSGSGSGGGGDDTPLSDFNLAPQISACGGFVGENPGAKIPPPDPTTYCNAERLLWNYDASTKTLGLTNSRVLLNCCGDHSITVTKDGDTVVFTETDAPENGTRCKCMCVYDYASDVSPIDQGILAFRLVRNVTDVQPAVTTVWEGTLDLAAGMGEVAVNTDDVGPWCTPGMP